MTAHWHIVRGRKFAQGVIWEGSDSRTHGDLGVLTAPLDGGLMRATRYHALCALEAGTQMAYRHEARDARAALQESGVAK